MQCWKQTILASALSGLLFWPTTAAAPTEDELAKQTQNPVASLISVPLQGNWDFGLGDRDATSTLLNIQPVMPFGISQGTNSMFVQPFANYNIGGGLAVGATIEATANFEADEAWTAPLLFSVSKVTRPGARPGSFLLAAGPTITSAAGGAEWRFRLAATLLFPT